MRALVVRADGRASDAVPETLESSLQLAEAVLIDLGVAMGPVIAGLILWAGAETYADRLLAGFIYALCLILFLLAAVTDWLDGYLARSLGQTSRFGAFLDPVADKLIQSGLNLLVRQKNRIAFADSHTTKLTSPRIDF